MFLKTKTTSRSCIREESLMDVRFYVKDYVMDEDYTFDTLDEVREFLISVYEDAVADEPEMEGNFDWGDFLIVRGVEVDPSDLDLWEK